jgi:bacteriorhodopsin
MESWSSQLAQRARAQDSGMKAAVNIAISQYSATARKPPGERSAMSLVSILVALIVVGVLLWLVNQYIPMDRKIKTIFNVVVVVAVVLWLLYGFGVLGRAGEIRLPRIR